MPERLPEIRLPIHLRRRSATSQEQQRTLYRAILDATGLLGLAFGNHESAIKNSGDKGKDLIAELAATKRREALAWEIVDILLARFGKLPQKNLPHFTPVQRFRILEIKSLLHWSAAEAERVFMVCTNTLGNWTRGVNPDAKTIGSLAKPDPPVRRIADVVRRLVQSIAQLGFGDAEAIAKLVTANGHSISPRTVARVLRETPVVISTTHAPERTPTPVVINFVNHVWMMDSTFFKTFFNERDLAAAAVFDGHSRTPLAVTAFEGKPSGSMMANLLERAVAAFGKPKYVITDQGPEFICDVFQNACVALGIKARFASKENIHATARLERFWRTLKDIARLRAPSRPTSLYELEQRLAVFLTHYVFFRPHRGPGMDGATPAEVFEGREPAVKKAKSPPRGRPGKGPMDLGIEIRLLPSTTRNYPFLVPVAA